MDKIAVRIATNRMMKVPQPESLGRCPRCRDVATYYGYDSTGWVPPEDAEFSTLPPKPTGFSSPRICRCGILYCPLVSKPSAVPPTLPPSAPPSRPPTRPPSNRPLAGRKVGRRGP